MKYNSVARFSYNTEASEIKKSVVDISNGDKLRNLKKGIRLINGNVVLGANGPSDFIENKFTAVISYDAYKIPRIVSRHLLTKA